MKGYKEEKEWRKIYILPYIYQGIIEFKWEEIMKVISNHKKIEEILKQENKYILSADYKNRDISQIEVIEHENDYYLAHKMLNLIGKIQEEDIIKTLANEMLEKEENKQRYSKDQSTNKRNIWKNWFESKKDIDREEENRRKIEQLKRIRENREKKGVIPVLEIDEAMKNFKDVIQLLGAQFDWVIEIANFIEVLTTHYIKLKDEFYKEPQEDDTIEPMDYFLFDEQGKMRGFIGIHTLEVLDSWYMPHGFEFIEENNLRVFRYIVQFMYDQLVIQASLAEDYHERMEALKESPLEILCKSQNQLYSLSDLEEVVESIRNDKYREVREKKKIGIFMDTANIYTPLKNIGIDFNKLLVCIYGPDKMKDIIYKYCTLLFLEYPNEYQHQYELERKSQKKKELEEYGFEVIEVKCKSRHANQKDDEKLQDILDSHINTIQEALILTGDGHFVEYFRKYTRHGIQVKIISIDEETTANTIKKEFGNQLYYLEECWEAINL